MLQPLDPPNVLALRCCGTFDSMRARFSLSTWRNVAPSSRTGLIATLIRWNTTVKSSSASNPNPSFDSGDRPTFHVVIIYEDSTAGTRAKHLYDRVTKELEDECDFSLELWSFEVLGLPEIGNSSAQAAAKADLVILKKVSSE